MFKRIASFILILIACSTIGTFTGRFIQTLIPEGSPFFRLFGVEETLGVAPATIDLIIFEFTIGFFFKLTLVSVLFIIAGAYIFKPAVFKKQAETARKQEDIPQPEFAVKAAESEGNNGTVDNKSL